MATAKLIFFSGEILEINGAINLRKKKKKKKNVNLRYVWNLLYEFIFRGDQ